MDEVSFLKLLQDNGIRHEKRGHEIWYQCPIPGHSHEDRNFSASYSLKNGHCNCFVHGGGITNLISYITKSTYEEAKILKGKIDKSMEQTVVKSKLNDFLHGDKKVSVSECNFDVYCKKIHKKYTFENFTDNLEIIKKFEIGYDEKTKRLTFPLRDRNGKLVLIFKRSVIDEDPRYIIEPKDTEKSEHVFGINLWTDPEYLIVVEAAKSVIRSYHNGVKNVVSIMGSKPSEKQMSIILKKTGIVYSALDEDRAGREGEEMFKIYQKKYGFDLRFVKNPELSQYEELTGKIADWANYTKEEMMKAYENASKYFDMRRLNV